MFFWQNAYKILRTSWEDVNLWIITKFRQTKKIAKDKLPCFTWRGDRWNPVRPLDSTWFLIGIKRNACPHILTRMCTLRGPLLSLGPVGKWWSASQNWAGKIYTHFFPSSKSSTHQPFFFYGSKKKKNVWQPKFY